MPEKGIFLQTSVNGDTVMKKASFDFYSMCTKSVLEQITSFLSNTYFFNKKNMMQCLFTKISTMSETYGWR